MNRPVSNLGSIVLAGFLVIFSSCGLFETRIPDPPTQTSSSFTPPVVDSLVFVNLVNALKDMNSLNYLRCLADTSTSSYAFQFDPTAQARQQYGVFLNWTKQSEEQCFVNVKSKLQSNTTVTLEFLTLVRQSLPSDSTQYEATYRLTVPHTQPNVPTVAQGRILFFLVVDRSRYWVIRRWVDISLNQGDFTWSDVKGVFGQ